MSLGGEGRVTPNLTSVKEEYQVSTFFEDDSSTVTANSPYPSKGALNWKRGERVAFATFCDLVREPWREGGMELGTEVLFTRLTGFLVFKNPKCKTCYQIIENSVFLYSVLPKTGKTGNIS